jgi:hypothetical protein
MDVRAEHHRRPVLAPRPSTMLPIIHIQAEHGGKR